MRLREPHPARIRQPETARWVTKGFFIGTSVGLRLALSGAVWLTLAPGQGITTPLARQRPLRHDLRRCVLPWRTHLAAPCTGP